MEISLETSTVISEAIRYAKENKMEYITPEVILLALCVNPKFRNALIECGGSVKKLKSDLKEYLSKYVYCKNGKDPTFSDAATFMLALAGEHTQFSGKKVVDIPQIVYSLFELEDSYAVYYLQLQDIETVDLMRALISEYDGFDDESILHRGFGPNMNNYKRSGFEEDSEDMDDEELDEEETDAEELDDEELSDDELSEEEQYGEDYELRDDEENYEGAGRRSRSGKAAASGWQQFAPCINDMLEKVNPLIGREAEIERTIQILCRKDKNNPLHIGEPGVGKTAITYGLARMIKEKKVPEQLENAKIFSLDLGGLIAGTRYRGDFEKRIKKVLAAVEREEKPIVYIDEIHNLYGAGATGEGSYDASNLLKPYLSEGHIRFIGATTYEEYKKYFEKSRSLVRRFQNVEINEPSKEETIEILKGLKSRYEEFHGVRYDDEILKYIVEASSKYINERFLPDKAIDLMDESGAYRKLHPVKSKRADRNKVNKDIVNKVLTSICRVPLESVESNETEGLAELEERLKSQIFGQEEAITQVTNAVKFSKAGLLEEGKPLASLLFVGPTGVGKTEIARKLASELGVRLIRFDMSEYEEKYAVSKLIGASAGYVGYENGGLLTEEIRKSPSSVLLLDEIEKAHEDIYNILLQVMDYATLTDNQGRKADFRNVIIIMTSNIGADKVGKNTIGFRSERLDNTAMMDEVKRVFKPEFRNRLSRIVIFNSMDEEMAERIIDKKLGELKNLLQAKNIELMVDPEAKQLIKEKGISIEYGAREVERVIRNEIKPLFVDSILFGSLKKGGKIKLTAADKVFQILLQ